jgi:hypothetical protein
MTNLGPDLLQLDRDVRRAARSLFRFESLLKSGTDASREQARASDPFDSTRHTSARGTYDELCKMQPSLLDVPLRDALARWVHELLQARISTDLAVAAADAEHYVEPSSAPPVSPAERPLVAPLDECDYREAFERFVLAPNDAQADTALARVCDLAPRVSAVRNEQRMRRQEAARRLGLAHPNALAGGDNAFSLASAFLDATQPLADELARHARPSMKGDPRAATFVQRALGRDATEGWPAHALQRWLDDAFRSMAPRCVNAGPLAPPTSSASFLRAAYTWGFAWKASGTPASMPFALARDPYSPLGHRLGFTMASVVGEPIFQKRVLELPARIANNQARHLRATMFAYARTLAVRTLLSTSERVTVSRFEDLTSRLFGTPLPAVLHEAWPDVRADETTRFLALFSANTFIEQLVQRFDEDWFRNPKAGAHLTSLACAPAFVADPVENDSAARTARAFERALA